MNSVIRSCLLVIPCSLIIASFSLGEPSFSQGVKSYHQNELELARDQFLQALKESPANVLTLYNLGLAEYKLGKKGLGLAYWRKALDLSPGDRRILSAITFASDDLLANKPLPVKPVFETFRDTILVQMSFAFALLSTFVFSFGALWVILTHLGSRRRALILDTVSPNFPLYGYLLCIISAFFASITTLKNFDRHIQRATVISTQAIVRSGPNEEATNLFELFEGSEVVVRQSKDMWTQVTLPGKSTGWVMSEQLYTSN